MGMCGGDYDPSEAARWAEIQRQGAIGQGQKNINQQFSGFGPAFYDARKQSYLNFATPQLSQQVQDTGKGLTFQLARQGLLHSGAAEQQGRALQRTVLQSQQQLSDTAANETNQLRQSVEQERSRLTNQLVNSGDPTLARQQAYSAAQNLQLPSMFAPIGQAFQQFGQQYLNKQMNQAWSSPYGYGGYGMGYGTNPGSGGGMSFLGRNRNQ